MDLRYAWLPEDQWLVKEGKWVRPRNIALASNAFSGKYGSKHAVKFGKRDGASSLKPHNTLLNRAKATRAPTMTLGSAMGAVPLIGALMKPSAKLQKQARRRAPVEAFLPSPLPCSCSSAVPTLALPHLLVPRRR